MPWNLPIGWPNCLRDGGPVDGVGEGALGAAEAEGGDLQAGGAEPLAGDLEALVRLAEHGGGRQADVVELEDLVGVAAVRDVAVAVAHGEARRALVDEEGGDALACGPRGVSSSPEAMKTMAKPAMSAWLMKCLVPFRIQSSPSGRAVAFMPRRSEPASGSVIARQSQVSPRTQGAR